MDFFFKKISRRLDSFFDRQNLHLKQFSRQHDFDRKLVASLNRTKQFNWKYLKYLPKFLSTAERRQLRILSVVIIACLAFLAVKALLVFTVSVPKAGGEYSEGLVGSPRFLNPLLSQTNSVDGDLTRLIFSSLLVYDKNHQLVPDLASSYNISTDQLTYTFHLKSNVKWQDGETFTADDVVFTVASLQDPEFKSPLAAEFRGVICQKVDANTVTFTLKEPFTPFLSMLTFGILPEHLWYNVPPANADLNELNKKPIGTGPWKVDSYKKDSSGQIKSYTLTANSDYYGIKPFLSQLIFKFYGDTASAIDAFKSKDVDGLSYLPLENRGDLKKNKNVVYHDLEQPQYAAVFFNQKTNSLLQADYIRQALALSTDKQKIISQVLNGEAKSLDAPLLTGLDNSSDIVKYNYNPEAAASLLEKNGWVLTATSTGTGLIEQVRRKKGYDLQIVLTVPDQPQYVAIANIIKQNWDQIGVRTVLNIVDRTKIVQEVIDSRKYEALLFSENMSSDPDPFAFWDSSQEAYPGANLAIFTDKKADQLLEAARQESDPTARQKDYWQFQNLISSDLPVVFLYSPYYTYPQDQSLKGFNISFIANYSDRFANLNEWYVKTQRVLK